MDKIFDIIEFLPVKLFHFMHNYAKKRAYKKNLEYRKYEDTVKRFSTGNTRVIASNKDPLLTVDNWHDMDQKVYEVNPWLHIFHKAQLVARYPRNWYSEFRAAILRVRKGYDYSALWNFSYWHAEKMVQMLTELRDKKHTHPCDMTPDEWDKILNEIIAGFQAALDMENIDAMKVTEYNVEYERLLEIFDHGMDLMKQHYFSLWD